jgi:hypothetical protein
MISKIKKYGYMVGLIWTTIAIVVSLPIYFSESPNRGTDSAIVLIIVLFCGFFLTLLCINDTSKTDKDSTAGTNA